MWPWNKNKNEIKVTDTLDDKVIRIVSERLCKADYYIDCRTPEGQQKAYDRCDLVSTVVGKRAESIANLKVWAVDGKGAQIDTPKSREILGILNHPNPYEDFSVFNSKIETFKGIYGKAYVYKRKSPTLGDTDYYVIPNYYVTEVYGNGTDLLFNPKIREYQISDGYSTYSLRPEEVYVFYDKRVNFGNESVFGKSRMYQLSEPITNYSVLWEVSTELFGDGGAKNLISLGASDEGMLVNPLMKNERDEINQLFKGFGLRRKQAKTIVTKTKAEVHRLTVPIKDFDIPSVIKNSITVVCNAYDYPPYLFGLEANRYKSTTEAMAYFYTQSCIPTAQYIIKDWLAMLEVGRLPFKIEPDYSHLDFYQESKQKQGGAVQQMAQGCSMAVQGGFMSVEDAKTLIESII